MERFAGRYRILRHLGQGGMGQVSLALDLSNGTECVVKRLRPDALHAAPDSLRREFELLARVRHPLVVAVYELGFESSGAPYLTMEYVPGLAADQVERTWDTQSVCFVGAQVAQGLEALHAAGVVHGDLKPSNLLLLPPREGEALPAGVRLVDFGLASLLGRDTQGHRGTFGFAAPEVVRGAAPSVASDLYGLGALLYTLARGPERREDPTGVSAAARRQQVSPPPAATLEEKGLAGPLVQLVLRLMSPSPEERPTDAREVRREFERIHPAARRTLDERLQSETFAGRDRELGRLERLLQKSFGGPCLAIVEGEAGVGKTALLTELGVRATLAGRTVVRVACRWGNAPGEVGAGVLRRLAAEAGVVDVADAAPRRALEVLEAADPARLEAAIPALAHAAAGWCAALAAGGRAPLVLLDDGERMDALSRSLLRAAAMRADAGQAFWVWGGRAEGTFGGEDDRMLVEAGRAVRLALGPLDLEGATKLVATRLHEAPPAALLEFLWSRTGGHPGMLVEVLRSCARAGALREGETGLVADRAALAALELPGGFVESLLARLAAGSERARAAADALAVWDRPASLDDVRVLAPAADAAALAELAGAGLAAADEAGAHSLRPPRLGLELLARRDGARLRALHRAALARPGLPAHERFHHLAESGQVEAALAAAREALEAHADPALAERAAALADASGSADAAHWLATAGRLLHERGRHREALAHLERALTRGGDPAERPEWWVQLTTSILRTDRPEALEATVERALAEEPPPAARASLLVNRASRRYSRGEMDAAEADARAALELAEASGDDVAIGHANMTLGAVLFVQGRFAESDRHADRCVDCMRRAKRDVAAGRALALRAGLAAWRSEVAQADALFREALALVRGEQGSGARVAEEELLMGLAALQIRSGRWADAETTYGEGLRLALEDGRSRGVAVALSNLALLDTLTGRPGRALRRARAAVRLARRHLPRLVPFVHLVRAAAFRIAGRLGAAERASRASTAGYRRLRVPVEAAQAQLEAGKVRAAAGRWAEAESRWTSALWENRSRPGIELAMLEVASGRAAIRRRAFDAAAEHLGRCQRWLEGRQAPYVAALAQQLAGELALAQGRAEEGTALANQALDGFARLPALPDRAGAALDFARLASDAGVATPVEAWLDQAAAAFVRLGDHRGRERALALQVEWLRGLRAAPGPVRSRDLLRSVGRLLDSLSDLGELTRRAMQLAVEQLDAECGVLLLADEKTGTLAPVVEQGAVDAATRNQAVTYSRKIVERVAASGGALLIHDAGSDPGGLSESMVDLRLRSIVCVPLYRAGKVVGAVYLDDSRRDSAFSDTDRALLEGFAQLLAIAIEKSRGEEEERRRQEQLEGENLSLRREANVRFQPQNFIGMSSAMQKVLALAERAAQAGTTVLITGEGGTGKEMIARVIHHHGRRRNGPLVTVNCGAIAENLLESELFGILPSVATGVRGREGRFVQANGGTLFLDEIGDMPLQQQVALLSAISSREVTPVGGGPPIAVDVRIIAATNQELRRKIEEGRFREDLYYRLNVLPIEVPPLREHKADIPALAHYFAAHFAKQLERDVPELSPEFIAALMQSDWPGNVRELQNYIERVMAMSPGNVLVPNPLPRDLEARAGRPRPTRGRRYRDQVAEFERELLQAALDRAGGNKSRAARDLGLTEQTLRYRLQRMASGVRKNRRIRKTSR